MSTDKRRRQAIQPSVNPRSGFTILELSVVLILISLGLGMALPRLTTPPEKRAEWVAQQFVRSIELARTRAQSTRKRVRMVFDVSGNRYASYLDDDRDGAFSEDAAEMAAFLGSRWTYLNDEIRFGRGMMSGAPGDGGSGAVTFTGSRITFDSRGIPIPLGTTGYIYVHHMNAPEAVAAIRLRPSGSADYVVNHGGTWR